MRKIVIILSIFAVITGSCKKQQTETNKTTAQDTVRCLYSQIETYEEIAIINFLIKHCSFKDCNPTHQEAADKVNFFVRKVFEMQYTSDDMSDLISEALQLFYNNSIGEFEDSPDVRRMATRRSMCFMALAFLSEDYRYPAFLSDARETLSKFDPDVTDNKMLLIVNMIELYKELSHKFISKRYIEHLISQYQDDLESRLEHINYNFATGYREVLSKILKSLQ